jgi:outer membrane receptor for ferrienterochelin and colicins
MVIKLLETIKTKCYNQSQFCHKYCFARSMMKKFIKLVCLMAPLSVLASDVQDLESALEQTTQIATKTKLNIDFVPGTVSVISGNELKALGIINISQQNALDIIVGMDSSVNALRGSGPVFGGHGNKIKYMINGTQINSQLWGGDPWGRGTIILPIPVDFIERVEVLRGPNSSIYGDNAVFGTINVITKKSSSVFGGAGVTGAGKFENDIGVIANVKQNNINLTIGASTTNNDGANTNIKRDGNFYTWDASSTPIQQTGYGPGDLSNGIKSSMIFANIEYDKLQFNTYRLETNIEQGGYGTWYPTSILPPQGNYYNKSVYSIADLSREFRFGGLVVTPKVSFATHNLSFKNYIEVVPSMVSATNTVQPYRNLQYSEVDRKFELDGSYKLASHTINTGAVYSDNKNPKDLKTKNFYGDYSGGYGYVVGGPLYEPVAQPANTNRIQKAVYAQDIWDVTEALTLMLGGRYDYFIGDISLHAFSPRVAAVYKLDSSNIIKAQYSRAFCPPTFVEISGFGSQNNTKPETIDTVEVSYIYTNSATTVKGTLFSSRIYNMIGVDEVTYSAMNLNKAPSINGLEVELKHSLKSVELVANMAYYKSVVPEFKAQPNTFSESSFVLAPNMTANFVATINKETAYPTTFWYHHIGSKPALSSYYNSITNQSVSNSKVPAQSYINISQEIKNIYKKTTLRFGVQNLLDQIVATLYMPLSPPNNNAIPYMRRSVWANLKYEF